MATPVNLSSTEIVAIISGLSGLALSLVTLFLGLRRQRTDDKKVDAERLLNTAQEASNLVSSAKELTNIQKSVYENSMEEQDQRITKLSDDLLALRNQMAEQKNQFAEQIGITAKQQTEINILTLRDKSRNELVVRLIKGINILIKQMKDENITPRWVPAEADIATE
jgi:hypothetical protein